MALKIPLQRQGIETDAISGVCRLEGKKNWNGIDRIFESSAQKSRQMRICENPSVAESGIEDSSITAAAADRVAATRPYLDFVAALLRRGLSC